MTSNERLLLYSIFGWAVSDVIKTFTGVIFGKESEYGIAYAGIVTLLFGIGCFVTMLSGRRIVSQPRENVRREPCKGNCHETHSRL
jgi:hypothetical protein